MNIKYGIPAKENASSYIAKGLLFFLSPIISLVSGILTIDRKSSAFYIGCFGVFWCFIQIAYSGKAWDDSFDIDAYRMFFEEACSENFHDFILKIQSYFSLSVFDRIEDLYSTIILFIISRFTDNYHIFFAITGAIVSFFIIKSFYFVISIPKKQGVIYNILVFSLFFLHAPLYWIGGLRWITAAWIAVYSVFQILINQEKKYYFLLLLTPFVHFSFWLFLFIVIVADLSSRFEKLWFWLLLSSFALQIVVSSLYEYLLNLQDSLPFMFFSLGDQAFYEEGKDAVQELSFIKRLFRQYLAPIFPSICCLFCYYFRKSIDSPVFKRMLAFVVVLTFFFNIFSVVPDLGRRLGWILYPFIGYVLSSFFRGRKYAFIWVFYVICFAFIILAEVFKGPWSLRTEITDVLLSPIFALFKYL